jgi:hypothetical protein
MGVTPIRDPFRDQQQLMNPGSLTQTEVASLPLFPPSYRCKLRYADSISVTSTSGIPQTYVLTANGLYDPDITGTGHQPAGFDQMMVSFEHYTVLRSRIVGVFRGTSAGSAAVGIAVRSGTTAITVANQLIEDGLLRYDYIMPTAQYGQCVKVAHSVNVAEYEGVSNPLDVFELRGDIATNPSEQMYYHVTVWDTEGGTRGITFDFFIEYEAVFTEYRSLTESLLRPVVRSIRSDLKATEAKAS